MTKTLAVALVHGIGNRNPAFADGMIQKLRERVGAEAARLGLKDAPHVEFEPIDWADAVEDREDILWRRVNQGGRLDYADLREFLLRRAGDAIAYQPTPWDRAVYDRVHVDVAKGLKRLAARAGPDAPLVVIAHSLGTVIASNYLYDLQATYGRAAAGRKAPSPLPAPVAAVLGADPTPLEKGETLAQLWTMGSPLAIWGLRSHSDDPLRDFGTPIEVPSSTLAGRHPGLVGSGPHVGWTNLYDRDDVIAYPLKTLNPAHAVAVKADVQVNVGTWGSWTPLCHTGYWTAESVTTPIAHALARAWEAMHGVQVDVQDSGGAAPTPKVP